MNKVICISLAASIIHQRFYLLIIHRVDVQAVSYVLSDSSREQYRLLLDDGNLIVVPLRVQLPDVASVEKDLTFFRVIESLDQRDDR